MARRSGSLNLNGILDTWRRLGTGVVADEFGVPVEAVLEDALVVVVEEALDGEFCAEVSVVLVMLLAARFESRLVESRSAWLSLFIEESEGVSADWLVIMDDDDESEGLDEEPPVLGPVLDPDPAPPLTFDASMPASNSSSLLNWWYCCWEELVLTPAVVVFMSRLVLEADGVVVVETSMAAVLDADGWWLDWEVMMVSDFASGEGGDDRLEDIWVESVIEEVELGADLVSCELATVDATGGVVAVIVTALMSDDDASEWYSLEEQTSAATTASSQRDNRLSDISLR